MSSLLPNGKQHFDDNNGRPLVGGRVYYYIPNTSTPKDTWQDEGQTILNTNPIVLDARGECTAWGFGRYRQVVRDSLGNLIWDRIVTDFSAQIDEAVQELKDELAAPEGADMIGFIQEGNGAVARTALDKMRESVSVEDFGAVGDGIADDTPAVQAALNSGAKYVHLRQGRTYKWVDANGPTIPSNVWVKGNGAIIVQPSLDTSATSRVGVEYCGFRVDCGVENVVIEDVQFRGPYYGTTQQAVYRSIGFSVSGRYDQYFYNNPNWPANPPTPVTGTSVGIKVFNCKFDGWGQSGIIADQILQFVAQNNTILNCGRDGIRMYGCRNFDVSDNYIDNMTPGFDEEGTFPNNNVYGVTATRVYHSSAGDGSTTDYPPSSYGVISRNIVRRCPTWKALDTHGGTDIVFADNIVFNAHIAVGIDKGGFSLVQGYAPPRRLKVRGNILVADPSNSAGNRCGIFAVANDATDLNIGEDLELTGNHVEGYGEQTRDGNIVVSNYRRVIIGDSTIKGGLRAGVNFQNTVEDYVISNLVIQDIGITTASVCTGINAQGSTQRGIVDSVAFRKTDTADTMVAISSASPSAGYGVKVGPDVSFTGNISYFNSGGVFIRPDSPFMLKTLAWANVNNGGTATLAAAKGIASVTRTGTGVVRVVMTAPASTTATYVPTAVIKGTTGRTISCSIVDESTVDVTTRDPTTGSAADSAFFFTAEGF